MILDVQDPRWSAFVARCHDATLFHHPVWVDLLHEVYGYRPLALASTDAEGRIAAGVPVMDVSSRFTGRRWVSLPFTDSCAFLTEGQPADEFARALIDEARTRRLDTFELRTAVPAGPPLHTQPVAVRHRLALSADPDAVYGGFSKMHRRNIRKAEQTGMRVAIGHGPTDIAAFYRLHLLTRRRLGVPIQPRRFFRLLSSRLLARGFGFVLSVHVGDIPVAAAVFLHWNGVLIYKYGASDEQYWEYRPNNLLFREAIRWGCEHGCHTLDWGRTDLDDRGLRDFKQGWGAHEEPLYYSIVGDAPPRDSSGPLKKAMATVIRRSSPWVCQAVGELFYRYAA